MAHQKSIGTTGQPRTLPGVRAIAPRDLTEVLAKGWGDFRAMPTHAIFLIFIYPLAGLVIAGHSNTSFCRCSIRW